MIGHAALRRIIRRSQASARPLAESIDGDQVRKLAVEGMGPTAIARTLGISRPSVYKRLRAERGLVVRSLQRD